MDNKNQNKQHLMSDYQTSIKELLETTHEAYTIKDISRLINCPVATVKRIMNAKLNNVVKSAHLQPDKPGWPLYYWMSPSKYDDYDEPLTKMEILKELLKSGEEVSYLTFGNKQDGDSTVYTYIERLKGLGWNIERIKDHGKAVFKLVGEPGREARRK